MTLALRDTLSLLRDVGLIYAVAMSGVLTVGAVQQHDQIVSLKHKIEVMKPDLKFAQTFMIRCLNQEPMMIGRGQVGVLCQTF